MNQSHCTSGMAQGQVNDVWFRWTSHRWLKFTGVYWPSSDKISIIFTDGGNVQRHFKELCDDISQHQNLNSTATQHIQNYYK